MHTKNLIWLLLVFVVAGGLAVGHEVAFAGDPAASVQSAMCGDVNGSGSWTSSDLLDLFDYLFRDSSLADTAAADMDSFQVINVSDLVYYNGVLCCGSDPSCPPTFPEIVPAIAASDTLSFEPKVVPAFATSAIVLVEYRNSQALGEFGIALPMRVRIGDAVPEIDSVKPGNHDIWDESLHRASKVNLADATVNAGFFKAGGITNADSGSIVEILMTFPAEPFPRSVRIDTLRLPPANSPLFRYNIGGFPQLVVPVMNQFGPLVPVAVSGPLEIGASNTVEMIVMDPNGDSITVAFNTIGAGANYNVANNTISIPQPYTGNYEIRVNRAAGAQDEDTYSLSVTIQSLLPLTPQGFQNRPVPLVGANDEVLWRAALTLPGDVDGSGSITSGDVIRLVNHVFKGGEGAEVPRHEDVNCDVAATSADIIYLVNYVFKGGSLPCSQTAR
jgi:hypothetical protein